MKHLYTSVVGTVSELDGESPLSMKWDMRKKTLVIEFPSRTYNIVFKHVVAHMKAPVDPNGS